MENVIPNAFFNSDEWKKFKKSFSEKDFLFDVSSAVFGAIKNTPTLSVSDRKYLTRLGSALCSVERNQPIEKLLNKKWAKNERCRNYGVKIHFGFEAILQDLGIETSSKPFFETFKNTGKII